ncbi:MAG: hypothetical protein U0694_14635 [Anaerolineae bacterium]
MSIDVMAEDIITANSTTNTITRPKNRATDIIHFIQTFESRRVFSQRWGGHKRESFGQKAMPKVVMTTAISSSPNHLNTLRVFNRVQANTHQHQNQRNDERKFDSRLFYQCRVKMFSVCVGMASAQSSKKSGISRAKSRQAIQPKRFGNQKSDHSAHANDLIARPLLLKISDSATQ